MHHVVSLQLGRKIKNPIKVVKICRFGFPVVIRNEPIFKEKPFPTNFWLVCPFLRKKVSDLEAMGFIERLEEELKRNYPFFREHEYSHRLEIMLRKPFLDKKLIPRRVYEKLISVGAGGIENPYGVKCLHTHLASFLGGLPNPIGERIYEILPRKECPDNLCGNKIINLRR